MGAAIGLWVALTLAVPASLRPINLNLPPPPLPPQPPARSPPRSNVPWTPTPPPSWRPAWLPTWLIPDQISVPTRNGCGWGFHHNCPPGRRRR